MKLLAQVVRVLREAGAAGPSVVEAGAGDQAAQIQTVPSLGIFGGLGGTHTHAHTGVGSVKCIM